jgi:hypothetical protein
MLRKTETNVAGLVSNLLEIFRLGNLRASLSKKELDDLPDDTLRDSVKDFGRTVLPPYKVCGRGWRGGASKEGVVCASC